MFLTISGIVILIGTVYLLAKRYETRLVLFCSGFLMSIVAGKFMAPFQAFSHAMLETKLFESIIAAMGFSMVMKVTGCDKHLINLLIKPLRKAGPFLIPAVAIVVLIINVSITSSSGCSAAVGPILIPLMLAAGIHPPIAAAAIYVSTYAAMFNPGYPQVALIVSVSKASAIEVVANHFWPLLACGLTGAFGLLIVAKFRKEDKGYVYDTAKGGISDDFKVNWLRALVPIIPVILLILGSTKTLPAFSKLAISHAMIIGCICAFFVTRVNPTKISNEFWHGAGDAFGHIFGIIICALVFVSGLASLGLIQAMITAMISNPSIAKASATFGPFALGILSGSGDAASVAFNKAVTIHASQFGLQADSMGSVAAISAALGRTMSPMAGGMIICAGIAGTTPIEAAKRNAPAMIIGCFILMFTLLY